VTPVPLLAVRDLSVSFDTPGGEVRAARHVSLEVAAGETVGLVGESGSGKSVTALSILQLLPYPVARHPSGSILFQGQELLGASEATLRQVRGNRIAMIFQEPMTSLNPLHTIEKQINEVLFVHKGLDRRAAPGPGSSCGSSACRRPSGGSTRTRISSRAASGSA
jgi:microcin C transport system ATP-binding protein